MSARTINIFIIYMLYVIILQSFVEFLFLLIAAIIGWLIKLDKIIIAKIKIQNDYVTRHQVMTEICISFRYPTKTYIIYSGNGIIKSRINSYQILDHLQQVEDYICHGFKNYFCIKYVWYM